MPKFKFEDIAFNITQKRKPTSDDMKTYIGLEHLDSGSLSVTRWGSNVPIKGDKLIMQKGDILFGKRNAYLRRASIAPHDGLFSAHGMVLRPNEKIISRKLFPFFICSDYFFDAAIRISVGSLSPTINWSALKKLEFILPDMNEQEKIADLLWAANDAKEANKKLLFLTDELIKSQFIEMFGDPITNSKGLPVTELINIVKLQRGFDLPVKDRRQGGCIPVYGSNGILDTHDEWKVEGGIITGRSGTIGEVHYTYDKFWPLNTTLFSVDLCGNNITYLAYLLKYFHLERFYNGTGVPTLNRNDVHREKVIDIPLEQQNQFADFVQQADKSKLDLTQNLDNLEITIKVLMSKNFG